MQSIKCSLAILITILGFTSAADFLRAGLVAETEAQASLSTELTALQQDSDSPARKAFERIRGEMSSLYAALPKDAESRLTHQTVRYALHRFFARQHGWFMRGLEPTNESWHHLHDDGVKEWVPTFLQDVLETGLGQHGTNLDQLTALAATLEDLVRSEARGRLETVFQMYEHQANAMLSREQVNEVIQTYFAAFTSWGDLQANSPDEVRAVTVARIWAHPAWKRASEFVEELKAKHLVAIGDSTFDFESILRVVDKLDEQYSSLNAEDCADLKGALSKMQGKKPGRVRLAALYNKKNHKHWIFDEKKEFLQALGVLDETDPEHPSVIITNYLLSRDNCLDSSHLFSICCKSECEELMGKLEGQVWDSMVEVARVAEMVRAMPSATVAADRELAPELVDRLHEIANIHGGLVPLHGRLFAQWMHHAYPLECPYPDQLVAVNPMTRDEWLTGNGKESDRASQEEIAELMDSDTCKFDAEGAVIDCEGETAEIAWSDKEELLTWHPQATAKKQSASPWTLVVACVLAALGLVVAVRKPSSHAAWRPLIVIVLFAFAAFALGLLDGTLLFLVLACGCVVVVANRMTVGNVPKEDAPESKHFV